MKPWIPFAALLVALSPLAFVHPVRVHGRSMEPLLKDGTMRLTLRSWWAGHPKRYEVWLVQGPQGPAIKRVVGLPGERLEQRDGVLFLNGQRLDEPYLERYDRGDVLMEARGGYLMLGDNRQESQDSRVWGPLPDRDFRGRILGP